MWWCTHRWRRLSSPVAFARLCTGRCIWRWDSSYPSRDSRSLSRCWSSPHPHERHREDLEDLRMRRHRNQRCTQHAQIQETSAVMSSSGSFEDKMENGPMSLSLTSDHQLRRGRDVVHRRLRRTAVTSRVSQLRVTDQQLWAGRPNLTVLINILINNRQLIHLFNVCKIHKTSVHNKNNSCIVTLAYYSC